MVKMNKIQDPVKTQQIMKEFEKQNMKMGKLNFRNYLKKYI